LGVGENRFERAWQQYKPEGINLTNYWGVDFVYGYSYLLSVPAKNGILGTLAWLFFIVMIVWSAIKLLFKKSEDFISSKISIIHAFVALFFVLVLLMHVPSVTILILAFVFLGLFLGSLGRNGLYNSVKVSIDEKPKLGFLYIFIVIVLMIVSIYLVYMNSRQFVSTVLLERANYSLNQGDLNATRNNIVNSINFFATDMNLRSLSEYYQIEMGRLLQNQSLENQATVDAFRNLLTNTINASAAAINFDRNSYQNHVSLATVYEQLIGLNVEGSYDQSIAQYEAAMTVNPTNPGIYINMARSAFAAERNEEAREYIVKALEMKPRFVDAVFLLSQIQVAEGNIDEAIRSVDMSIQIQPNNPNLHFQMGLLRYNKEDFTGAVSSFENAVILQPFFANAKYFLGISYERVGRTDDAILQFEDLQSLNPNNEEVQTILENLKSGQSTFSGVEEEEEPEDRDELPVEEPLEEEE
jgi:tetratricopeptide (TPR) repeat protein